MKMGTHVRLLRLPPSDQHWMALQGLKIGMIGVVLRRELAGFAVVRFFDCGDFILDGELAMKVAFIGSGGARRNPLSDLTARYLQVLALLADGKPYDRIANELSVSYKTVANVSSQLKQKLQAGNLPELVSTAVKLLTPSP